MSGPSALILSIIAGAFAQLAMKAGLLEMTTPTPSALLICGVGFYGIAMISWVFALKRYDLSFAYPMLSLGYLLVYVGAYLWPELGEDLTWNKTIGLILVTLGVTISAQKDTKDKRIQNERQHPA